MNVLGLDHLEFYVGDARQTAYFLCTAFGFRVRGHAGPQTGMPGQRSLLLRHGDIHLVLTSGLQPRHPATEYVSRHGDGVAVIGIATADVNEAYETIVANGGSGLQSPMVQGGRDVESRAPGSDGPGRRDGGKVALAMVGGFGDVTHRLVQRDEGKEFWLPGFELDHSEGSDDGLLQVIDHVAICVPGGQLRQTSAFYQEVFGFNEIFDEYIEVGGQGMDSRVVQSASRDVTFTLIEPDVTRKPGQIDDFLQWHAGAGVQHVAFGTDDIIRAVGTFADRGVGFLSTPSSYYDDLPTADLEIPLEQLREHSVLVDRDHWGRMYQIFTQSMHVRRTLFLELIERHGALTFGSSNIKALYEAKQRELAGAGGSHA